MQTATSDDLGRPTGSDVSGAESDTRRNQRGRRRSTPVPMYTSPLTLTTIEELSGHARDCVFWEVDPDPMVGAVTDPGFEKEAWVSMVMLEWGSCGRIVWDGDAAVGHAIYAPPVLVPRTSRFPTAPVSADAILLAQLSTDESHGASATVSDQRTLFDAVVDDLVSRGARAIEAFGYRDGGGDITEFDPEELLRGVPRSGGADCSCPRCMIPAALLEELGFEKVAPHHRFPRYRWELGRDIGWKAGVESALDGLVDAARIDAPVSTTRSLLAVHEGHTVAG